MSNAGTNPDPLALDDVRRSIDFVASAADELEQHRRWFRRYVAEERRRRKVHDRRMRRQAALIEWRERRRRLVQSVQRAGLAVSVATHVTLDRLARAGVATLAYSRRTTEQVQILGPTAFASGARGVALARAKTSDLARSGVAASISGAGWSRRKSDAVAAAARKGIALGRDWAEAKRSALVPRLRAGARMLGDVAHACLAATAMHAEAYRRQAVLVAASAPKQAARLTERAKLAGGAASRWLALTQARTRIALMQSWRRARSAVAPMKQTPKTGPHAEAASAPSRGQRSEIAPRRGTEIACVEPWRCQLPAVPTRPSPPEMPAPR